MSKNIDLTKPLSDEDRDWLKQRSRLDDIAENERVLNDGKKSKKGDDEPEFVPRNTVAAPPIEPGSAADNPPQFVGQRPYGVDRAVWGGSTGLTEEEAYERTAREPHAEVGPAPDDDPRWQQPKLANPESTASASDAAAAEYEEAEPEDLTVDELKDELRARELPLDGNKPDLVKRLKKALREESK